MDVAPPPSQTAGVFAPPPPPPSGATYPGYASAPAHQPEFTQQWAAPAEPRERRNVRRIGIICAALLVLGGLAFVGYRTFVGADAGSSTPDGAVSELAAAIQSEDPAGVIALMAPSELAPFTRLADEASDASDGSDQLAESGLTIDPDDLIPGLQLTITSQQYTVEKLASDVAKVTIDDLSGDWSFDADAFIDSGLVDWNEFDIDPDELRDELDSDSDTFDVGELEDELDADVFLMVVEEDGSWFISPTYTILEYVRVFGDYSSPDFGSPSTSGGATPEEAIENMVEAAVSGDLGDVFDALPPTDAYRPYLAYRDMLEEAAGDGSSSYDIDVSVDQITTEEVDGGVRATIDDATVEWSDGYENGTLSWDGQCFDVEVLYSDGYSDIDSGCLDDLADELDNDVADALGDLTERLSVVVTRVDGEYFVDPARTIEDWFDAIDLDALVQAAEDAAR